MSVNGLRKIETQALSNGKIDAAEAKNLIAEATTAEDKRVLRDMLAHDNFDPKARALIARAVKDAPAASTLVGTRLGTAQSGAAKLDVLVARELSPNEGYDNQWQAMGAARASGETNTAVIQDAKGRWHAVETNISMTGATPAKTSFQSVLGMPTPDPAKWARLRQTASEKIQAWQANPGDQSLRTAAESAYKALMAESLGVDAGMINVVSDDAKAIPGLLNFNLGLTHGQATTTTFGSASFAGLNTDKSDKSFRGASVIIFGPDAFSSVTHAGGTLTHEATHLQHQNFANEVFKDWRDTGPKGTFTQYLLDRRDGKIKGKSKLTLEEYDFVHEQIKESGGPGRAHTEVLASTNEFFATYAHLDPNDPKALALKPLGDITTWRGLGDKEVKELRGRFQKFYDSLDDEHRLAIDNELVAEKAQFEAEVKKDGKELKNAAKPPLYGFEPKKAAKS